MRLYWQYIENMHSCMNREWGKQWMNIESWCMLFAHVNFTAANNHLETDWTKFSVCSSVSFYICLFGRHHHERIVRTFEQSIEMHSGTKGKTAPLTSKNLWLFKTSALKRSVNWLLLFAFKSWHGLAVVLILGGKCLLFGQFYHFAPNIL